MKPICVTCKRFYRPKKNGFFFIEGMPAVDGAKPGNAEPQNWKPYKLYAGDLWECPDCHSQIVSGVGAGPIGMRHEEDFAYKVESYQPTLSVNDC